MKNIPFGRLHNIYTSFAVQKDYRKLLDTILHEVMEVANCDAGTLYTLEDGVLEFRIVKNKSKDIYENHLLGAQFPPVAMDDTSIVAVVAKNKQLTNIEDIYAPYFPYEGPKKYDSIVGYKTLSMLIIPLEDDHGQVAGVIQLMNALENGNVVPFDPGMHHYLRSICVQAAICLTNIRYAKENKDLLTSVVEVLTTAIDARSVFNANHTRNMAKIGQKFVNYLTDHDCEIQLSPQDKEQLVMAIWLHDIGKLAMPGSVLNKSTRLGAKYDILMGRIEMLLLAAKVAFYENTISQEECDESIRKLNEIVELVNYANKAGYVRASAFDKITRINEHQYINQYGQYQNALTDDEVEALSVIRGTLTEAERDIMESHVVITAKMLEKIKFSTEFQDVPIWASAHHEFIDGTGYPLKLSGKEVTTQMRILTIIDIFEALISTDRPYKSAMSVDKALMILDEMAHDGKLDAQILGYFEESKVWENL